MIDFSDRKVNNFDTTGHMPFADGESPPERVFQYLTELSNSQNNGYNFPNRWSLYHSVNDPKFTYPRQYDEVSCGLYVIYMADVLSVKCPEYYNDKPERFDLSSYFKGEKLRKISARFTVLALIMNHDVTHFKERMENAHNPSNRDDYKQYSNRRDKVNNQ